MDPPSRTSRHTDRSNSDASTQQAVLVTALSSAKPIKDFDAIHYPEGIQSPNTGASKGFVRYNRKFLLQFRDHCKEKPEGLNNLEAIGIDPNRAASVAGGPGGFGGRPPPMARSTRDEDSTIIVDREVKALLNKLTMVKFDSISDQLVEWANKSESENDGKRRPAIPQEEFEHGWAIEKAAAAAAAIKAAEDQAIKEAAAKSGTTEIALYSEEYYASEKAKRRGLGLIRFIGELFKLQVLTERRIMHKCLKKLLGNVDNPDEEDIESVCKLLGTVGAMLDTPKAANHMAVYFSRIEELRTSPAVSSRIQFHLLTLHSTNLSRNVSNIGHASGLTANLSRQAPRRLLKYAAAKERAAADKESYTRQISRSRGGDRGDSSQVNADGWAVAGGGNGPPRSPAKAGDLSNFGKIRRHR